MKIRDSIYLKKPIRVDLNPPDYMLLEITSDKEVHKFREVIDKISDGI